MQSIKAVIQGDGVDSSVEFSVEEMITQHQGKPWKDMSESERDAAMKDYALLLFSRHSGVVGDAGLQVILKDGTFSKVEGGAA